MTLVRGKFTLEMCYNKMVMKLAWWPSWFELAWFCWVYLIFHRHSPSWWNSGILSAGTVTQGCFRQSSGKESKGEQKRNGEKNHCLAGQ
jgi:hypothetical protein